MKPKAKPTPLPKPLIKAYMQEESKKIMKKKPHKGDRKCPR